MKNKPDTTTASDTLAMLSASIPRIIATGKLDDGAPRASQHAVRCEHVSTPPRLVIEHPPLPFARQRALHAPTVPMPA